MEIPGCIRNGISREAAETIFEDMVTFASYAFNKSHAAAYAVLAYETGYLKRYYPVEFMAALMTSVMGDSKQVAKYIRNCVDMGIEVLPPDVNQSFKKFTVTDGRIRFGLLGVKNVGEGAIDNIVKTRESKGLPKDIFQFINNIDTSQVNKKAVESLIKAGAMNCFTENKAAMLSCFESLMESAQNEAKKNIEGQISLFQMDSMAGSDSGSLLDVGGKLPDVKPFTKEVSMSMEKEMLGVYLSDHPLKDYVGQMRKLSSITCEDILRAEEDMAQGAVNTVIRDNMSCTICGIVTTRKTQITKNGAMMAFIGIEDLYGTAEIVVFPKVYERVSQLTEVDKVIQIRGTLNFKEDEAPKILANDIIELESDEKAGVNGEDRPADVAAEPVRPVPETPARPVKPAMEVPAEKPECMIKIRIPGDMDDRITMDMINTALKRHPGDKLTAVLMYMPSGRTLKSVMRLEPSGSLKNQLIGLLGMDNVKF